MNSTIGKSRDFGPAARVPKAITATLLALVVCVFIDAAMLAWIRIGPPPGKTDSFFLEFALLLVGTGLAAVSAVFYPSKARTAIPLLFIVLAWHTGLQISFSNQWPLVLSTFDILVPLALGIGIVGGWHTDVGRLWLTVRIWKSFRVFAIFLIWGLALALARGTDGGAMLMNFRSYAVYPLITLVVIWTIRTWRQLYVALGLMLGLMFERALLDSGSHGAKGVTTILSTGQVLVRNGGGFASINQFALYLMSGILIMIGIMVAGGSQRLRIILAAPLVIVLIALVTTYSRGAYLGVAAGLVILALFLPRRRAAALIAITVLLYAAVQVLQPSSAVLVSARLHTFDHSAQVRLDYLSLGRDVIANYPFGAGWGAAFTVTARGLQPDLVNWPWYHDDYLQLATEVGVFGLLAFAWIWYTIARLGFRAYRQSGDRLHAAIIVGLLAAIAGMLVQAFTEQFFWRADIAPHIWIVAGLLLAAVALVSESDIGAISPGA